MYWSVGLEDRTLLSAVSALALPAEIASAVPLALASDGSAVQAGTLADASQVDVYRYVAPVSGRVALYVDSTQGFQTDSLSALDARGNELLNHDHGLPNLPSSFDVVDVAWGETYYLVVSGVETTFQGDYLLGVTRSLSASDPLIPTPGDVATTSGTIETPGQINAYEFIAPTSGRLTFRESALQGTSFASNLILLDGTGNELVASDTVVDGVDELARFDVTAGRTYFVLAGEANDGTGTYTVGVSPDDFGDTPDTSYALPLRGDVVTTQSGAIEVAGDRDMFRFVAPATGPMTVGLEVLAADGLNGSLFVLDNNGSVIGTDQAVGGPGLSVQFQAVRGQPYFAEVAGSGTSTGHYSLTVTPVQFGVDFRSAYDLTPDATSSPLEGMIGSAGQVEYFRFVAPATGVLSARADPSPGSTLAPGITAYDANQNPIASPGGGLVNVPVEAGLTYFLAVAADTKATPGTMTGAYTLSLTLAGQSSADGPPASATQVALGLEPTTTGFASPGPQQFFRINPTGEGRLVAVLSNVGFVARLSLYDGQNLLVQSDGSAGGGPDELIDQHLQAGTFFLGVAALSGSGTFRLSTSFTATSAPFASSLREFNGSDVQLASADFNHDGVLDLVTPEGVRLGTGDGTFQAAPTGTPTFANMNTPDHIVTGDLNGDGIPDLVVTDPVTAEVTVLLGRGDGTFRRLDPFAVPGGAGALVEADFNHDGRPDLAVAGRDSAVVTVLLGNGDGTFRLSQSLGTSSTPGSLAVGDFNGDGRPDLAVACQTSTGVSVLYGQGDGTFSGRVDLATTYDPSDVAAGDLNGDGRSDLIVLVGASLLTTYLSQKDGGFLIHSQQLGGVDLSLATGDFNHDGHLDVALSNFANNFASVLLGNGDGTFQDQSLIDAGQPTGAVLAGDFNGDGRTDLAFAPASGDQSGFSVYMGRGDGTFQAPNTQNAGFDAEAITTADFNGDGIPDLVAVDRQRSSLTVLLGRGDGNFRSPLTFPVGANPDALVVADFNGDGRPDLAVADYGSNTVSILLGRGDGTFETQRQIVTGDSPSALVTGDFNGDGIPDLAVVNDGSSTVTILLGRGDGTFAPPEIIKGDFANAIATGDFYGDGKTDLAVASADSANVYILRGDGQGSFEDPIAYPTASPPQSLAVADFNGDGWPDLVTVGDQPPSVSVLLNKGHGLFGGFQQYPANDSPVYVAAADLGGRGIIDLVVVGGATDVSDGDLTIFQGDGLGGFQQAASPATGYGPVSVAVNDFNGDGRPDLAVATYDGLNILLGLGGGTFTPNSELATIPHQTPVLADLNGDGTQDVIVTSQDGRILWRKGRPGAPGSFDPPVVINPGFPARDVVVVQTHSGPVIAAVDLFDDAVSLYRVRGSTFTRIGILPTGHLPVQILAGDLNGDGNTDLIVRCTAGGVASIYLGDGLGDFRRLPDQGIGMGVSDIALADLSHPGVPDIVLSDQITGDVRVLPNLGDATFGPLRRYRAGAGLYALNRDNFPIPYLNSLEGTSSLAVGNFVAGGPLDVVALNPGTNTIGLLTGLGGGRFSNPVRISTTLPGSFVRAADLTGDGVTDLVILDADGLQVVLGDGKGGFLPPVSYDAGPEPTGLTIADVNHDGRLDLLVGNPYGDVLVLQGNGDGTFQPYRKTDQNVTLAVADLTGSGKLDVVLADQGLDRVSVQYGGGGSARVADHAQGLVAPGAVQLVDLNGDGIKDLVVANSGSNNVLVYPGLGGGRFGPALNDGHGFFTGTNPVGITVADVGNGRPDLVVANKGSNDVSILLNQPTADGGFTFTPGPRLKAGAGPVSTAVQYQNGKPDILVSNSVSNNVMLIPGVGNGFFNDQNPITFPVGNSPGPIFVGNFDGKSDLVTVNAGSNDVTLVSDFMGQSPLTTTISSGGEDPVAAFMFQSGNGFDSLIVADNGDGHFELLEGSASGFIAEPTITEPGLPNPTSLAFATLTGGQIEFFATTAGVESATLLSYTLPKSDAATPSLVPLRDSSLALVATLLTLTIESTDSQEGNNPSESTATPASFLPGTSVLVVQALLKGTSGAYDDDGGEERSQESVVTPTPSVAQAAPTWERFVVGLDEAFEEIREKLRDRFVGDADERAEPPTNPPASRAQDHPEASVGDLDSRREGAGAGDHARAVDEILGTWQFLDMNPVPEVPVPAETATPALPTRSLARESRSPASGAMNVSFSQALAECVLGVSYMALAGNGRPSGRGGRRRPSCWDVRALSRGPKSPFC